MHLWLGIQEIIYPLFHYASLHSGKDKWTINLTRSIFLNAYGISCVFMSVYEPHY